MQLDTGQINTRVKRADIHGKIQEPIQDMVRLEEDLGTWTEGEKYT